LPVIKYAAHELAVVVKFPYTNVPLVVTAVINELVFLFAFVKRDAAIDKITTPMPAPMLGIFVIK